MAAFATLGAFVAYLQETPVTALPAAESWERLMARLTRPGQVNEIDKRTYCYFLDVLPPRFLTAGLFAFAEGQEPLRLFWHMSRRYFARQLTWDETRMFCTLVGIPLPH